MRPQDSIILKKVLTSAILVAFHLAFSVCLLAQISPGELTQAHAHLEGMSHCTDCHTLGARVSNEKCLECHVYIKDRIAAQKGYHSSDQVKGKECASCHNEHHGRNFRIINFDMEIFDHQLTGYDLLGAHRKEECKSCHKPEFIADQKLRSKDVTFLGLNTECLSCHGDYHQGTLSADCMSCHGMDTFIPAVKFNHSKTKYPLIGKHQEVDCNKCHSVDTLDGVKFQKFAGIKFSSCTDCHRDVHQGKFGPNCRECHSEESFHVVGGMSGFDHSRTDFPLLDKHRQVSCKQCHKTKYTDPVRHALCVDCHEDYHRGDFIQNGSSPDCSNCHDTKGFSMFSFTLEQHNRGRFKLEGAHLATPCFICHKKEDRWRFRDIGLRCVECHEDIHKSYIDPKYYPEQDCKKCHGVERWTIIDFNHSVTKFELTGGHTKPDCRDCHFRKTVEGNVMQEFTGLPTACANCHKDIHAGQFEKDGLVDCQRCHTTADWKASRFDHNTARFILDGKHKDVACNKCHKSEKQGDLMVIKYKLEDIRCEACH